MTVYVVQMDYTVHGVAKSRTLLGTFHFHLVCIISLSLKVTAGSEILGHNETSVLSLNSRFSQVVLPSSEKMLWSNDNQHDFGVKKILVSSSIPKSITLLRLTFLTHIIWVTYYLPVSLQQEQREKIYKSSAYWLARNKYYHHYCILIV